jgi:arginase
MRNIRVISAPSSAGARQTGQERAPWAFRRAGLVERLRSVGASVMDEGDVPEVSFQPDDQRPRAQNIEPVLQVARELADRVDAAVRDGAVPMVLGGDCTITIGVLAGMVRHTPNLGLLYFDGDLDLNTPDTTVSGILDGMVMAHILGEGIEALARVGPRFPLMDPEDVVMFGYNPESPWIDAAETLALEKRRMLNYPLARISGNAGVAARQALAQLGDRTDSVLVHFDVDVIDFDDFPAGDVPHHQGLAFDEAMTALRVFLASPKFAGLVITEFNANRDPEGILARRLVEGVAEALPVPAA